MNINPNHPLFCLFLQSFCSLYFERTKTGGFVEYQVKPDLLLVFKNRLIELNKIHHAEATKKTDVEEKSYHSKLSELCKTVYLWISETSIKAPKFNIGSLLPEYDPPRLKSLLSNPLFEVSIDSIGKMKYWTEFLSLSGILFN